MGSRLFCDEGILLTELCAPRERRRGTRGLYQDNSKDGMNGFFPSERLHYLVEISSGSARITSAATLGLVPGTHYEAAEQRKCLNAGNCRVPFRHMC